MGLGFEDWGVGSGFLEAQADNLENTVGALSACSSSPLHRHCLLKIPAGISKAL